MTDPAKLPPEFLEVIDIAVEVNAAVAVERFAAEAGKHPVFEVLSG